MMRSEVRTTLLLLMATAFWSGIAHGESVPSLLDGPSYELEETFRIGNSEVRGYSLDEAAGPQAAGLGHFCFTVRPAGDSHAAVAYTVHRRPSGHGQVQLAVGVLDLGRTSELDDLPAPARVLTAPFAADDADYAAARDLIRDAEEASSDWDAHREFLDEALSPDPEAAHQGWWKVAMDLEGAYERHPDHLGILKDLIVAYTQMNAFERGTERGANLSVLIPQLIAEFEDWAAPLSTSEQLTMRRARALFYFQTGLYPLALAEAAGSNDWELAGLRKAMRSIGQGEFTQEDVFDVEGEVISYTVTAYKSGMEAPSDRMLHFRWFFVTQPKAAPDRRIGSVWYSLASQTLTDQPRFYLYGHTGHTRSLLMMYGTQEPTYESVKAQVVRIMAGALRAPAVAVTSRRLAIAALAALALAAVVALRIMWRLSRRRQAVALGCMIACVAAVRLFVLTTGRADAAPAQSPAPDEQRAALMRIRERLAQDLPPLHAARRQKPDAGPEAPPEREPEPPPERPEDKAPVPVEFPQAPETVVVTVSQQDQPSAIMTYALPPHILERIVKGDLQTVDLVRTRLAEAVVAGAISEAMGAEIAQSAERLANGAIAMRNSRQFRIEIAVSPTLRLLSDHTTPASMAAARINVAISPSSTRGDSAATLASEAFEFGRANGGAGAPVVVGRGRHGTPHLQMDTPRIAPSPFVHPVRAAPAAQAAAEPEFVPKGVKILIDETMLAKALQGYSEQAQLDEIEALEDSVLNSADGIEVFQKLQQYTEAKKAAFLDDWGKSRRLDGVRLVSLDQLVSQAREYLGRWDRRPEALRTVAGLTRIHGFVRERTTGDLLLVGRAEPGAPPILLDDLAVGLRVAWRDGLTPGCSLDPDPSDTGGPQYSRIMGVPEDSSFALIMLDADYAMKRIMAGVEGEQLDIPGYRTVADCSFARPLDPGDKTSRFWLFPVQPNSCGIQLGLGGTSVLFEARVQVLTEALATSERGSAGTGRVHPKDQEAADSFTEHYDAIAEQREVFKQLQGLFDIVLLAKILRRTSPDDPLLESLSQLPYSPVDVPNSYRGHSVTHVRGDRMLTLVGGCDIRQRAHFNNMIEAHTRGMAELTAEAHAVQSGEVWYDLPGLQLSVPAPEGAEAGGEQRAYSLGAEFSANGDWGEADRQFTLAIAANGSFAQAYAQRAVCRFNLGRPAAALWDAGKAISLDPRDPAFRITYRRLLLDADVPGALDGCDPATLAGLADDYWLTGVAYTLLGELDEAKAALDVALRADPRHAKSYAARGVVSFELGDYQGAIEDPSKALEFKPDDLGALITRGVAHTQVGAYEDALRDLDRAWQIEPGNTATLANRAEARRRAGDMSGALADAGLILRDDPDNSPAYVVRGLVQYQQAQYQAAIESFTTALDKDPLNVRAYTNRGVVRQKLDDLDGAWEDCNMALLIDPTHANALINRANMRLLAGDGEGALEDYSAAIESKPYQPRYRIRRGRLLMLLAQAEPQDAEAYLRRALEDAEAAVRLAGEGAPERAIAERLLGEVRQALADLD